MGENVLYLRNVLKMSRKKRKGTENLERFIFRILEGDIKQFWDGITELDEWKAFDGIQELENHLEQYKPNLKMRDYQHYVTKIQILNREYLNFIKKDK